MSNQASDIKHEVNSDDLDAVMKKYDRESNVRVWTGKPALIVKALLIGFSLFCVWVTLFSTFLEEIRLTSFMGLVVLLGFLQYPANKNNNRANHIPWYDLIGMIFGAGAFIYYTFSAEQIIQQGTRFQPYQIVIAIIGILALLEVTRRSVGWPILIVALFFIIYALVYGLTNPSFAGRARYLVRNLFYAKTGILSTPINVCSKYIVVFIIFGAFLERTGISKLFINIANCIAGRFAGGPAKVAVISSALCGMVSGSSVGNTVTTGSVTIPMMKETGYRSE
ncbi:MAG: TRAP transporter large permease subunit, partial [Lachnospiraceae bacterium]|nr:TRAP transporter large permease subunit [Lachnospiraceae bacterium]